MINTGEAASGGDPKLEDLGRFPWPLSTLGTGAAFLVPVCHRVEGTEGRPMGMMLTSSVNLLTRNSMKLTATF